MDKRRRIKCILTCPCGKQFEATRRRIEAGKGKRCSKACQAKYAVRPSGLTYSVKVENRAWFKPGVPQPRGEAAANWRGDQIGYHSLHGWLRKNKTRPAACEHCGTVGPTEWANKSREYRRDLDDWLALCRLCHRRYDSGEHRGKATAKYGAAGLRGLKA